MLYHSGARGAAERFGAMQAEAVAYVVCQGVGVECTTTAADYATLYDGDKRGLGQVAFAEAGNLRENPR
jgi:hypothetical protein